MVDITDDDIARLASRLAMVVSEDGEAENAGRAMGQLARRLGMTGGHLKEIFMAGAGGTAAPESVRIASRDKAAEIERLEREITTLRQGVRQMEGNWRAAERERDSLLTENAQLQAAVLKVKATRDIRFVLVLIVMLAIAGTATVSYFMPSDLPATPPSFATASPPPASPSPGRQSDNTTRDNTIRETTPPPPPGPQIPADALRMAVVHAPQAAVFEQPDRAAPIMATLHAGAPLRVHKLMWNMLLQWAEIDVGSRTGYILVTDIDLS